MENAKYRCKRGVIRFELVHFRPLPTVFENVFEQPQKTDYSPPTDLIHV